MGVNTNRLTYRYLTESDDFSAIVDKINYNFDQNKAFGGGDIGKTGNPGLRGLPGATGIGKKGEIGLKGATIAFMQVALVDGQPVTDITQRDGDVVVDSNGSFFSVIKNNVGNLIYKFEYSLASAVSGSILETENQVAIQSANPIVKWYLRTTGNPKDANAVLVDRVVGAVTDEVQLYRLVVGDSGYPLLQNAALTLVNIIPDATVTSAKENFFAQLAFKYRTSSNSNVSSNTGYVKYQELNKNETTPIGPDDTYMLVDNISAGFGAIHDSLTTDSSYALIRGRNVRFMGKTPMDQLYSSGAINNAGAALDVTVDAVTVGPGASAGVIILKSLQSIVMESSNVLQFRAPTKWIEFASLKTFFNSGLYVGVGNYNGANTYAPTNGAVIEGAVGIGMTAAPYIANGTKLHIAGNLKLAGTGSAIIWNDAGLADIDHVWNDDTTYQNVGGTFHFVADGAFQSVGNAGIRAGAILTERAEFYDKVIVGDPGWSLGFAKGLAVQGRTFLGNIVNIAGQLQAAGGAVFTGTQVEFNTINVVASDVTTVEFRRGDDCYIGSISNYVGWKYWNLGGSRYEFLGWRSDINDWVVTRNTIEYKLWHDGNDGPGSGLNADKLDGIEGVGYFRKDISDSGLYLQFRGNGDVGAAVYVHQDTPSATQIQRWYQGNALRAYVNVDGTVLGQDFFILSDRKLKKNIKPLGSARDIINKLKPVMFSWKDDEKGRKHSGVIAQDAMTIIPHIVKDSEIGLSVSTNELVPYLIKGLQEAFAEIKELKEQIKTLLK